jgi:undecaprenyl diphosphate synthase
MIRTSGELRLSNFLLWENSYAEFIFNKALWPNYTVKKYINDLKEYEKRNIRKGGI